MGLLEARQVTPVRRLDQCPAAAIDDCGGVGRGFTVCHDLHSRLFNHKMQVMNDTIRLPDELGAQLRARRQSLGLGKRALAERAGKVREVIYRLEAGEDVTVSSLMAVLGALGLAMRLEPVGLPTADEVARRFAIDDDDEGDRGQGSNGAA